MTANAIHRNAHPMRAAMPLLPMSRDDALFWRLLRERRNSQQEAGRCR